MNSKSTMRRTTAFALACAAATLLLWLTVGERTSAPGRDRALELVALERPLDSAEVAADATAQIELPEPPSAIEREAVVGHVQLPLKESPAITSFLEKYHGVSHADLRVTAERLNAEYSAERVRLIQEALNNSGVTGQILAPGVDPLALSASSGSVDDWLPFSMRAPPMDGSPGLRIRGRFKVSHELRELQGELTLIEGELNPPAASGKQED